MAEPRAASTRAANRKSTNLDAKKDTKLARPSSRIIPGDSIDKSMKPPNSRTNSRKSIVSTTSTELNESMLQELETLRTSLSAAQTGREEAEKDLLALRSTLSILQADHLKLEETLSAANTSKDAHDDERTQLQVQLRNVEKLAEQDCARLVAERDRLLAKNKELSDTISRLRDRSGPSTPDRMSRVLSRQAERQEESTPSNESAANLLSLSASIAQKDKKIESLEQVNEQLEKQLQQLTNAGDPQMQDLLDKLDDLNITNAALREDVESYQTLLQDKTMNGEFSHSLFMQSTASQGKYRSMRGAPNGLDLASELDTASEVSSDPVKDIGGAGREELEAELLTLQETNKALSLYVNSIILRLLNTKGYEHVLAKDENEIRPAPSTPKKPDEAPSLLQKTRAALANKLLPATPEPAAPIDNVTPRPTSHQVRISPGSRHRRAASSTAPSSPVARPRSVYSSPSSGASGLRPLNTGAVADHISAAEAKRLSLRFAPAVSPVKAEPAEPITKSEDAEAKAAERTAKRTSWMGWLSNKEPATEAISSPEPPPSSLTSMPRSVFNRHSSYNSAKSSEASDERGTGSPSTSRLDFVQEGDDISPAPTPPSST